jgi:hypothetical protein
VTESCHIYNAVINTFKNAGFKLIDPNSNNWNIMWTGANKPEVLKECSTY